VFLVPEELPKQLGSTLLRSERTAGMQQHMMLTKISSTLQYAVGTLSSGSRGVTRQLGCGCCGSCAPPSGTRLTGSISGRCKVDQGRQPHNADDCDAMNTTTVRTMFPRPLVDPPGGRTGILTKARR
jgi:hypothetical protein